VLENIMSVTPILRTNDGKKQCPLLHLIHHTFCCHATFRIGLQVPLELVLVEHVLGDHEVQAEESRALNLEVAEHALEALVLGACDLLTVISKPWGVGGGHARIESTTAKILDFGLN
jgi:hypothetical protein